MGFHPANLTFRFLLELASLVGLFRLGLAIGSEQFRWGMAVGFTLAGMLIWATYRVPGDESAKGTAPLAVSGVARLVIETVVFGFGALGWFLAGPIWFAWLNLSLLALHHIISFDRIAWLLRVDSEGNPPFQTP
jgi:Protein of unknown function (DUF2568)